MVSRSAAWVLKPALVWARDPQAMVPMATTRRMPNLGARNALAGQHGGRANHGSVCRIIITSVDVLQTPSAPTVQNAVTNVRPHLRHMYKAFWVQARIKSDPSTQPSHFPYFTQVVMRLLSIGS